MSLLTVKYVTNTEGHILLNAQIEKSLKYSIVITDHPFTGRNAFSRREILISKEKPDLKKSCKIRPMYVSKDIRDALREANERCVGEEMIVIGSPKLIKAALEYTDLVVHTVLTDPGGGLRFEKKTSFNLDGWKRVRYVSREEMKEIYYVR